MIAASSWVPTAAALFAGRELLHPGYAMVLATEYQTLPGVEGGRWLLAQDVGRYYYYYSM